MLKGSALIQKGPIWAIIYQQSFFRLSRWVWVGCFQSRNWMFQSLLSLSVSVNSLGRAVLYSLRLHPQAIATAQANGVENTSLLEAYKVPHVLNPRNPHRLSSWHGWIQNAIFQTTDNINIHMYNIYIYNIYVYNVSKAAKAFQGNLVLYMCP